MSDISNTSPFGSWLKLALKTADMTPEQLANKVGISRSAIYFYFNDRTRPTKSTLRRICNALGADYERASNLYDPRPGTNEDRF